MKPVLVPVANKRSTERLKRRQPVLHHGSGVAGVERCRAVTGLPSVLQFAGHRAGGLKPDGKSLRRVIR
jgi:hypothetical protein